jgi:hypothetical protein
VTSPHRLGHAVVPARVLVPTLLCVGLLASASTLTPVPALAAATSAARPASSPHARLAMLAREAAARASAAQRDRAQPGSLTGTVLNGAGRPLAGVCVTAQPAGEHVLVPGRAAVTGPTGMFELAGLASGAYVLRYQDCAGPGGQISWSAGAALRPRAALTPASPSLAYVTGAQVTTLAPVTVRRGGNGGATTMPVVTRRKATDLPHRGSGPDWGGLAGKVTGHRGRPVAGLCWEVFFGDGYASGALARSCAGGVISGTVTGHLGHGLAGVCVVAATSKGVGVQQVTTPASGKYKFQGLDPGRYGIGFFPQCGGSGPYLPQWWPGTASETSRGLIKTGFATSRTDVDARLVLGGTISGVVRFRGRHGQPLRGMCVFASVAGQPFGNGYLASTNAEGRYAISGLLAGRYSVSFGPGCSNNGNYLGQDYPHSVTVRLAHVTGDIDAYLQPGAIMTGTVTAKSTGAPLANVCVIVDDGFGVAETNKDGDYLLGQMPAGKYPVEFANCADNGNYAPQFYRGQLNAAAAVPVSLRAGHSATGIDAALTTGATISGAVTTPAGQPINGACAQAVPVDGAVALGGRAVESAHGRYAIENLAPGQYQVFFGNCGFESKVAGQWFPDQAGEAGAAELNLAAGRSIAGIDAVLQPAGTMTGWLYGPSDQQDSPVCLTVVNARSGVLATDEAVTFVGDGYGIEGLAAGSYIVEFQPCGSQDLAFQWYDRASSLAKAKLVKVAASHTTSAIDAWLTPGGTVTGRVVSKSGGKPVSGVCVVAYSVSQPFFGFGSTSRSGVYTVTGLNSGTYRMSFSSCGAARLVPVVTGPVKATAGRRVAGPTVTMSTYRGGAISGRVLANRGGQGAPAPATGVCVDAVPVGSGSAGLFESSGTAGPLGYYQIGDLVPGRYKVFFGDQVFCQTDPGDVKPQWYVATSSPSKATVVTVRADRTTRPVSAALRADGWISGMVTSGGPAIAALGGICVQATPVAGDASPFLAVSAAANGRYQLGPLAPGRYLVRFFPGCGASGYATQWWKGAHSAGSAAPVRVSAGRTRSGINATMTNRS